MGGFFRSGGAEQPRGYTPPAAPITSAEPVPAGTARNPFEDEMSAEIIQFVPRPNDRRKKLDDMAIEIMNQCFPSVYPEFSHYDTSPSEYVAPDKDSA